MIDHLYPHNLASLHHPAREFNIFTAWGNVSRRVVVTEYHRGRAYAHSGGKDFAGMHKRGVERPHADCIGLYDLIAGIEKDCHKMLFLEVSDVANLRQSVSGRSDRRIHAHASVQHTARELQNSLEREQVAFAQIIANKLAVDNLPGRVFKLEVCE